MRLQAVVFDTGKILRTSVHDRLFFAVSLNPVRHPIPRGGLRGTRAVLFRRQVCSDKNGDDDKNGDKDGLRYTLGAGVLFGLNENTPDVVLKWNLGVEF